MYVSLIARYTLGAILLFAIFVGVSYEILFPFAGYTNVLAGDIQEGTEWQFLILSLWILMLFVLLSLVLYIKLHRQSKDRNSGL